MTEDRFLKTRFKPFSFIDYKSERVKNIDGGFGAIVECLLLAVDFDERLLKLQPVPDSYYEEEIFWARCEHCEVSRPKLKIIGKERDKLINNNQQ